MYRRFRLHTLTRQLIFLLDNLNDRPLRGKSFIVSCCIYILLQCIINSTLRYFLVFREVTVVFTHLLAASGKEMQIHWASASLSSRVIVIFNKQ